MWYFQNNKSKPNDFSEEKRNNASEPKTYHDNVKKPSEPTPEKRMPDNPYKMAETKMQPISTRENPSLRGTNLDDEIEKAMRDVKHEAKMPDIG